MTQSRDTDPVIEKKWIELLSQQSASQRLLRTIRLTSFALNLSRRAIEKANPGKSREELGLLFIDYHYGKELAAKVKNYLNKGNGAN